MLIGVVGHLIMCDDSISVQRWAPNNQNLLRGQSMNRYIQWWTWHYYGVNCTAIFHDTHWLMLTILESLDFNFLRQWSSSIVRNCS